MTVFRVKRQTFKIILVTSGIWLVVDLLMLMLYTDCIGEECQATKDAPESQRLVEAPSSSSTTWGTYPPSMLVKWRSREEVLPASSSLPGERGTPVSTPKHREEEKKEKFKINQFNLLVSDMISVNRSLKDYRLSECAGKSHPALLPPTSIVIVFHNEAWSTLLRTLHSIVNRSPLELVREILLVDDASSHEHLGLQLEQEVISFEHIIKLNLIWPGSEVPCAHPGAEDGEQERAHPRPAPRGLQGHSARADLPRLPCGGGETAEI